MIYKLPRIFVSDKAGQYQETLTCIQRDTNEIQKEMNQTDQINFTARNDGSIGYQLLQNENWLTYNGQQYHIKQADKDDESYDNKRTVSATHVWFDCKYVYQYDTLPGKKELSASDLMSFVFDQNKLGNKGFSWSIVGSNKTATFTDYGNKSGLDCINDCIEKFNLVVVADNKNIKLVSMDSWQHKTNKSFRYIHDTPTFKASIDTTDLQNITKVFGKVGAPVTSTIGSAIGTVSTMESNGAPVVTDPDKPTNIVQNLPNGTKWLMDSKMTANGETWYRVSTDGWVNEKYITFEKNGDISPENHITTDVLGQGTIKAHSDTDTGTDTDAGDDTSTDDSDTSTGSGNKGETKPAVTEAKIYDSPFAPQNEIGKTLANGTRWRINSEVSQGAGGKTWYQVATGEWVSSEDFDFSGDEDITPAAVKDDTDDDTGSDDSKNYFDPFIVRDEKSIAEWGERPGPSVSNDEIEDPVEMGEYALSQMKTEPEVAISLTYNGSDVFDTGDMVFCNIPAENFTTWVTVVSVKHNPLSYQDIYEVSLNSTPQTLTDYELSIQSSFNLARMNAAISLSNSTIAGPWTSKVGEV